MISNKLIAIDFGSTHISAIAAEIQENGAIKVLSDESKPSDEIKWGIVEKPTGASFKVSELLKLLKNSAKIPDITYVSVSVGAKSMKQITASISRFVAKPNIVTEALLTEMSDECERNLTNSSMAVFDVIPVLHELDGIPTDDPIGKSAIQITTTYHVVVGNAIIKTELERCFDRTGIVLEYNPLSIEAISTIVVEEHERQAGCALINFGATTTTLAVYSEGILQDMILVPLGASNITKDIEELGINEANAERLKCLKGCALESMIEEPIYIQIPSSVPGNSPVKISTQFLATIIEARLEEIMQPIFDAIDLLPFPLEAGIIITGGGSKLNNIIDFIAEKTGIYARMGGHSEWLSDDTDTKYYDQKYAQLIGTALLTNEYRKDHPVEAILEDPKKKPKIPKRNIGDKLAGVFINFFSDETENKF